MKLIWNEWDKKSFRIAAKNVVYETQIQYIKVDLRDFLISLLFFKLSRELETEAQKLLKVSNII